MTHRQAISRVLATIIVAASAHRGAAQGAPQAPAPVAAPDAVEQAAPVHHHEAPAAPQWTWSSDGRVFVGRNWQYRRYLDLATTESQNWFMGAAQRPLGGGRFTLSAMVSLEEWTLHAGGSPQLFQTGETFSRKPLVNAQHPHDLLMGLGASYSAERAATTMTAGASLVGAPTLGPTPFMHRPSAADWATVPLTHHYLDATHISTGVVSGGVGYRGVTVEGSGFRGAEPDEDRVALERPGIDSWAARVRFERGAVRAQASVGHLAQPERLELSDVVRVTASLEFDGSQRRRKPAMLVAWGQNRKRDGYNSTPSGLLVEGRVALWRSLAIYGRAEVADKELFPDVHLPGEGHAPVVHRISAASVGVSQPLWVRGAQSLNAGGDITVHAMPDEVATFWGPAHSVHAFIRWSVHTGTASAAHVH